jgi:hypothetical protein
VLLILIVALSEYFVSKLVAHRSLAYDVHNDLLASIVLSKIFCFSIFLLFFLLVYMEELRGATVTLCLHTLVLTI